MSAAAAAAAAAESWAVTNQSQVVVSKSESAGSGISTVLNDCCRTNNKLLRGYGAATLARQHSAKKACNIVRLVRPSVETSVGAILVLVHFVLPVHSSQPQSGPEIKR